MENEVIHVGLTLKQLVIISQALDKMPHSLDVHHVDHVITMAIQQARAKHLAGDAH